MVFLVMHVHVHCLHVLPCVLPVLLLRRRPGSPLVIYIEGTTVPVHPIHRWYSLLAHYSY